MNDHDHLTALLGRLKLTPLHDQLDSLIDEAGRHELTIREALTLFCEREVARRDQRRIDMSFGLARFPFVRDLTGFDFGAQPSLDKAQIREIATGRFIANGEAVLLLGPSGVGKTHLAVARSGAKPSLPATRSCLRRRRRWSRNWPSPTAKGGLRRGSPTTPSRSCWSSTNSAICRSSPTPRICSSSSSVAAMSAAPCS
ncbi:ATP-binding protein [Bosea sp. (in: a-proteobacteria)]|uniref:ATP-binding protein n=1 Tax=Bosea sp. (in: a-proteobacteria) TaxID=1871050 RepID=UPI0035267BA6